MRKAKIKQFETVSFLSHCSAVDSCFHSRSQRPHSKHERKTIVGLVFDVALADAMEHWKWLHWDFDDSRPVREFGWNKSIKSASAKTLSWDRAHLDFEHGGGGAFVLTSVWFEDGSTWGESSDRAFCRYVWYNHHKKAFVRPVELPFRQ